MESTKIMKKKIAIIGAGWFGCHIASEIIKLNKFDVQIFEKNNEIFEGHQQITKIDYTWGFTIQDQKKLGFNLKKGLKIF